jgi:hypothetical protein
MTGPVSINKNGDRKMDLSLYRYNVNVGGHFIEAARYDSVHNNFTSYAEVNIESCNSVTRQILPLSCCL